MIRVTNNYNFDNNVIVLELEHYEIHKESKYISYAGDFTRTSIPFKWIIKIEKQVRDLTLDELNKVIFHLYPYTMQIDYRPDRVLITYTDEDCNSHLARLDFNDYVDITMLIKEKVND